MTTIKTFTTLGSIVAFAGFASSASAAINSENMKSYTDLAVADGTVYGSGGNFEKMDYAGDGELATEKERNDLCVAAGLEGKPDGTKGHAPSFAGTKGIIKYKKSASGEIESKSFVTKEWAVKKHVDKTDNLGTVKWVDAGQGNWKCEEAAGATRYVKNVDGEGNVTNCTAYKDYEVAVCNPAICYYCDLCTAGSYQICYTAAQDSSKKDAKDRECYEIGAKDFYDKLAGMLKGLFSDGIKATNFYIATRYVHIGEYGDTGKNSAVAEKAFQDVLAGLATADPFYANLAASNKSIEEKYHEALENAIRNAEAAAANGG